MFFIEWQELRVERLLGQVERFPRRETVKEKNKVKSPTRKPDVLGTQYISALCLPATRCGDE
jgi:hypothetical protein